MKTSFVHRSKREIGEPLICGSLWYRIRQNGPPFRKISTRSHADDDMRQVISPWPR
jgi:hypothetical protein